MKINIFEYTGNYGVSVDIGELIAKKIETAFQTENDVTLDFKNVNIVITAFLYAVISNYYLKQLNKENKTMNIINLSAPAKIVLERAINSAKSKIQNN